MSQFLILALASTNLRGHLNYFVKTQLFIMLVATTTTTTTTTATAVAAIITANKIFK